MLHSWGNNQTEAFEQIAMAMFNYMTTNYDSVDTSQRFEIEADGQFLHSFFLRFCVITVLGKRACCSSLYITY
ncbi:unnamed protein product [Schistosoma haematobium]|nr:unnamed protein product [Schistosoma haematobium]